MVQIPREMFAMVCHKITIAVHLLILYTTLDSTPGVINSFDFKYYYY